MRPRGTGTIEPTPGGRFRPRMPDRGRARLRPCETHDEAERLLDAALAIRAEGAIEPSGYTLRSWGEAWLDRRDTRDLATDRSRWGLHVADSPLGELPLGSIERADVIQWLDDMRAKSAARGKGHKRAPRRKLGRTTVQNTLNLLRVALEDAVERGHLTTNPARGVRLPKSRGITREPWTYLLPPELERLLVAPAGTEDRRSIAFSVDTKMRQGEQWALELRDVHAFIDAPHAIVRYGGPGHVPTKNGKIRRVELFGMALRAAQEQIAFLRASKRPNPRGLLWPTVRGEWRREKKAPRGWKGWLATAGLDRPELRHDGQPVRWHSLRHTGASLRLGGYREQGGRIVQSGRRWTLDELKAILGHASVTTTERYAHLIPGSMALAAREHDATPERPLSVQEAPAEAPKRLAPPTRLELVAFGLGSRSTNEGYHRLSPCFGLIVDAHEQIAAARSAIATGGPGTWRRVLHALSTIEGVLVEATADEEPEAEAG